MALALPINHGNVCRIPLHYVAGSRLEWAPDVMKKLIDLYPESPRLAKPLHSGAQNRAHNRLV